MASAAVLAVVLAGCGRPAGPAPGTGSAHPSVTASKPADPSSADPSSVDPVPYAGTDDAEQTLIVRTPADSGADRPWVLLVHGGSWIHDSASEVAAPARLLTARGYVTFAMNYRLFDPGRTTYADQRSDVTAALRWIRRNAAVLGVDPARGALYGISAGGNLAVQAGLTPGTGIRAVVAVAPIVEPQVLAPGYPGRGAIRANTDSRVLYGVETQLTGCAWTISRSPACAARWSAITPGDGAPPSPAPAFFVYAGTQDVYSTLIQAQLFARAEVGHGVAVTVHAVDGAGHTQQVFLQHAGPGLAFLAAHLEG